MTEFPVFVPHEGEHVAAVVAVPDTPPRGLVVLATGLGATRSHRHQVWSIAADRLAALGIASVRFDYPGLHDSSGSVEEISVADLPADAAMAAARFTQRATGAQSVIAVGNCWGAQLAVLVAAHMEECVGAVCILPETVEPGRLDTTLRRAAGPRMVSALRRSRRIRRLVRPLGRFSQKTARALRDPLRSALEGSDVLFLYDREHLDSGPHAVARVRAMVERLPEAQRDRFELRLLPGRGLARFGTVEVQETVLEALVEWADRRFGSSSRPEAVPRDVVAAETVGRRPVSP